MIHRIHIMKSKLFISSVLLALLFTGCKQYDDGPLLSLYSIDKRVEGYWNFKKVFYGEADSSEHYIYQMITFYNKQDTDGGVFVWNHNILATVMTPKLNESGIWTFLAERDSIELAIIDQATSHQTITRWKINRLAYVDFWLERTINDTLKVEWKLWKRTF